VRGEQKKSSDLDILVEFIDGYNDLFNFLELKDYLEKQTGETVDLVMKQGIKKRLQKNILSEVQYV
jgi:hypothetical protein